MASAPHLDDLQKSLESLPDELNKNLKLLGELNSKSQNVMRNIDKLADNYMLNAKKSSSGKNKKALAKIQHQFDAAKAYGDDKVQLSIQTYEMVDKRIRNLDKEIKRFEANMKLKAEIRKDVINASINSPLKKGGLKVTSPETSKTHLVNAVTDQTDPTKSVDNAAIESSGLTMPIDPNEPTFCLCNQVSFGQMIACDDPDCPTEWFHFPCVDLITKPKGKWFCQRCVTAKK